MNRDAELQIDNLISKLKRRQLVGPYIVTLETAKLLRNVISGCKWNDYDSLIEIVMLVQERLSSAQAIEFATFSATKRILRIIHDERQELGREVSKESSDSSEDEPNSESSDSSEEKPSSFRDSMKNLLLQGIGDLLEEVENSSSNIAAQALEHIHSNEIIMTCGYSPVIFNFLKEAARFRKFQVIIAETAPSFEGHQLAAQLSTNGIETSVITDSAIFAVMSRVNKVILGAHSVTANGGVVSISGSKVVSSAAKYHATPVVVCAGLHTIIPTYIFHNDSFNLCVSPDSVMGFENGNLIQKTHLPNPYFDYVEPELLSLIITNIGPHPPSEIQRLVSESYQYD